MNSVSLPEGFRPLTAAEWSGETAIPSDSKVIFWDESRCVWILAPEDWQKRAKILALPTLYTNAPLEQSAPPLNLKGFGMASDDFIASFNYLSSFHHEIMIGKGFWNGEEAVEKALIEAGRADLVEITRAAFDGQKIALQASELSEALEGLRHGNGPDDKVPQFSAAEAEFADVILRLMDHAHKRGWRLAAAVVAKLQMNATRAAMHGGKKF
jgi:hypothetical protein